MKTRSGISLLEVLIAIFVMAIGLLALLTLFPVGALSMAQAVKDNRTAQAAANAEATAKALRLNEDDNSAQTGIRALLASVGGIVYVDPFNTGNQGGGVVTDLVTGVPQRIPNFVAGSTAYALRWFSLLDDIEFDPATGQPVSPVNRFNRFTWCYLLRNSGGANPGPAMTVVVYYNRPLVTPPNPNDTTYPCIYQGQTSLLLTKPTSGSAAWPPPLRSGSWVLVVGGGVPAFNRVVGTGDPDGTSMQIELQNTLKPNPQQAVVMEYVAEVFEKGFLSP
jgi:type II secretory pathway pseudopilin PulG